MSEKLPAIQFYPGDWKKDPGVQALNAEERGVWFEMLLLMHESEERGKLLLNGKPYPLEFLASSLRMRLAKLQQTASKILATGVASQDPITGVIYNRRMLRDEGLRKKRADAGALGGKQKASNAASKRLANPTPSSSSSSSSSDSYPPNPPKGGERTKRARPPVSASPGKIEEPMTGNGEMNETIRAFDFCLTPSKRAKRRAIADLLRQGCSHAEIRGMAEGLPTKPFYEIVNALESLSKDVSAKMHNFPKNLKPSERPAGWKAGLGKCAACRGRGGRWTGPVTPIYPFGTIWAYCEVCEPEKAEKAAEVRRAEGAS